MKHAFKIIGGVFFISVISFYSCTKDNSLDNNKNTKGLYQYGNGILAFSDQNDFASHLEQISEMDHDQLVEFQNTNNYESFGIICDDVYWNLADDSLSVTQLNEAVAANGDYLVLTLDPDGDYTLSAKFENNPLYYFMNVNRMYIVDQIVYKVFGQGQLSCDVSKCDELQNVTEENLSSFLSDPDYTFTYFHSESKGSKDNQYNLGSFKDARATNGSDRTLTEINLYKIASGPAPQYSHYQLVRPYKRTLGIWYWCSRTISCSFRTAVDVQENNGNNTRKIYPNSKTQYNSKIEFNNVFFTPNLNDVKSIHYAGYNCWGDTPSTSPSAFSGNTGIL